QRRTTCSSKRSRKNGSSVFSTTVRGASRSHTITASRKAPRNCCLTRSGVRARQAVYLTGDRLMFRRSANSNCWRNTSLETEKFPQASIAVGRRSSPECHHLASETQDLGIRFSVLVRGSLILGLW